MFYDAANFEFATRLEASWQVIREELNGLRDKDFIPWPEKYLYGKGWDTFGFYAFGLKVTGNCKLCPQTTRLLAEVPDLVSAGFSSLASGTHIAPHTGYPDGVLRCHLGLIVPEDCAIRVGTETRSWTEGQCLVFDDTMEHEAWNRSDRTRVVLLIDFKAPAGLLPVPEAEPNPEQKTTSFLNFFKNLVRKS
ncbi:MAG: aspartyl/asparaginyl beta-hydroxylase domain-containing protein [Leptolyngbyaceae cyanobacterium RU_5_1]|nr:aspartyl/asparaginyl beta-hydroxylase domain-containing protein [Leptolyngbyaceae cyanobacterium RU_5_1]